MSNNNNRRVRRRLNVPINLTNYSKNTKNMYIHRGATNNFPSEYTNLPREIGSFKQLESLSLSAYRLTSLPKEIGLCTNLKKL